MVVLRYALSHRFAWHDDERTGQIVSPKSLVLGLS